MITTRRNSERTVTTVANFEDIIRKMDTPARAMDEYQISEQVENEQAKARRFNDAIAKNFENLLYFHGEKEVVEEAPVEVEAVATTAEPTQVEEADLCPSSTTMQFREEDAAVEIYHDIKREATASYKINTKGKLLIAVYTLVIVTLFALIMLNTRALKTLDQDIAQMNSEVVSLQTQAAELGEEVEYLSSNENIIDRAKNELNMVLPE